MKNYLVIVALLMLLFGCSKQSSEADKASAEAAIKGFYSAAEKFDYPQMKTYCTPDFNGFEDGKFLNSIDDFIAVMKTFEGSTFQIKMDLVKTDVGIDMAHSVIRFDLQIKKDQMQMELQTFENYILKKIDGKWLISFYQSSYLNGPQKLEKGSILGIHILSDIELKPGVTMAQFEDFLLNKYAPGFNTIAEDIKLIPLRSMRGEYKDKLAYIFYLTSDDARNKYWASQGNLTEKGKATFSKIQSLDTEFDKMITFKKDNYTDWKVE